MLSQTAEYALRTVLAIAASDGRAPLRVEDLAQRLRLPRNYLSKTLHQLAREGILSSTRGKGGGFRLGRPADRIRLIDVVGLFDHIGEPSQCLLGRPICNDRNPCEAHAEWKEVAEQVAGFFRETTVGALVKGGKDGKGGKE